MSRPGQSKKDAKHQTNKFINEQIEIGTSVNLGRALHANEDKDASGHGFKEWDGKMDIRDPKFREHLLGDLFPKPKQLLRSLTKNVKLIKKYDQRKQGMEKMKMERNLRKDE